MRHRLIIQLLSLMQLIDFLTAQGYTVLQDELPLSVSLNQLEFPVAIVSIDYVRIQDNMLFSAYNVVVLYPSQDVKNLHKGINLGQAIHSVFDVDVTVSSVVKKDPDCSGALVSFVLRSPTYSCGYDS